MSNTKQTAINNPQGSTQSKLTRTVKRLVDFIWYFSLGSLIIWPIAILIIGFSIPSDIEQRHTDINFHLSFKVFSQQFGQQTNPTELIQGDGEIKLNNTKGSAAWYIAGAITEILGLIGLLAIFYLRKIFTNLTSNKIFDNDNVEFLQRIGLVFIAWNLIYPVLTYLGGLAILSDVSELHPSLQLAPAISLNLISLFTGLGILVLAGVIKEATIIHDEQSLTI